LKTSLQEHVLPIELLEHFSIIKIQDFSLRGKAVYLNIKRRRWRHKEAKKEIKSDYSFIAEGAKLTKDLARFLKGTGRDPRRYH
jgi:hypothetical protein